MSEDEQRRILRLLAIEKEQRRSHESLKKWATENFAILGHWKRAAEIKERAAENFSVLKSAPAKACSKKCTAGSKVPHLSFGKYCGPVGYLQIIWPVCVWCVFVNWELQGFRGRIHFWLFVFFSWRLYPELSWFRCFNIFVLPTLLLNQGSIAASE